MSADGETDRRTLLRVVIGLAIGIPVLVESLTFAGLLDAQFGGGGGRDDGTTTPRERSGVGVGDTLPVETTTARLADAVLRQHADAWTLELTVTVDNTGDTPVSLGLETVTTTGGESASGGATTGEIPSGETGTVTETWSLPPNATPADLTVVTTTYGDEQQSRAAVVPLGKVPVRG